MKKYDIKGREIKTGDLLKIYHFTAAVRRKRHYMYKLVIDDSYKIGNRIYLKISHMSVVLGIDRCVFYILADNEMYIQAEIIQGENLETRQKRTLDEKI